MNRLILLLIIFICFIVPATYGQILYKCTSPSNDTVVYLMGTHHRLPRASFNIDPQISKIIKEVDLVFTEIGAGDTTAAYREYQRQLVTIFSYPEGKQLSDYLSSSEFNKVKAFYRNELGIPEHIFNTYSRYRPMMMDYSLKKYNRVSVDNRIRNFADAFEKQTRKLDREENIFHTYKWMVESMPPDSLLRLSDNYRYLRFFYSELDNAYLDQDTTRMSRAFQLTTPETFIEEVLIKRNQIWIEILSKEMQKTNFIAVGIMHIYFRGGLIAWLASRGYTVKAIPVKMR